MSLRALEIHLVVLSALGATLFSAIYFGAIAGIGVALGSALFINVRHLLNLQNIILFAIAVLLVLPIGFARLPIQVPFDITVDRIFFFSIYVFWVLALLSGNDTRLRGTGIDVALLGFTALVFFSLALNRSDLARDDQLIFTLKRFLYFINFPLLFYLVFSTVHRIETGERILKFIVFLGGVIGFFGIIEFSTGYNIFRNILDWIPLLEFDPNRVNASAERWGSIRIMGSSEHPVALGALLAMTTPIAWHYFEYSENASRRLWYLGLFALTLSALFLTISRSSIVGALAAWGLMVLVDPKKLPRLMMWGLAIVFVIHMAIPGTLSTLKSFFLPAQGIHSESSAQARLDDYPLIFQMFVQKPLVGHGFETLDPYRFFFVDNQYLKSLVEIGLAGVVVLGWLFVRMMRVMRLGANELAPGKLKDLLTAISASAFCYMVVGATFDTIGFAQLTYIFFILVAVGVAIAGIILNSDGGDEPAVNAGFSQGGYGA